MSSDGSIFIQLLVLSVKFRFQKGIYQQLNFVKAFKGIYETLIYLTSDVSQRGPHCDPICLETNPGRESGDIPTLPYKRAVRVHQCYGNNNVLVVKEFYQ